MLTLLAIATLVLTVLDHWTTYLCLRAPVEGWTVTEANPRADWLFGHAGLVQGLLIDSAITFAAVVFLMVTRRLPDTAKAVGLALIVCSTGYAVVNNMMALDALGLSPLAFEVVGTAGSTGGAG